MRSAQLLLSFLCLAAAACGPRAGNENATVAPANVAGNAAAPAAPANQAAPASNTQASTASRDQVLRTETVTGTFTGWEMGDYLWGHIQVAGRREPISAQPGPTPIDLFLDANRGRPVTVEVATVRTEIPEAGGMTEIQRITAARNAAGTADAWWAGLSAADRAAAQRRFEDGALTDGR
jgi:hypothetical protein